MERIVFTGDVFRTQRGEAEQLQNAFLLHELMAYPICRATGIVPEVRHCGTGSPDAANWLKSAYHDFGLEPSRESWSRIFWCDRVPSRISEYFETIYGGSVVICFEMPPVMRVALDSLNIPWINVGLSPLRFLPDLLLDFTFSRHFADLDLSEFGLQDEVIGHSVEVIREWASKIERGNDYKDNVIFFAQTSGDRTLIRPDGFIADADVIDRVRDALSGRRLAVKRHPWGVDIPLLDALRKAFDFREIVENSYVILASEEPYEILTVSSSIAREGVCFGKPVNIIYPDVIDLQNAAIKVLKEYRAANFWRRLLSPVARTTAEDDFSMLWHYNMLRTRIGTISLPMDIW